MPEDKTTEEIAAEEAAEEATKIAEEEAAKKAAEEGQSTNDDQVKSLKTESIKNKKRAQKAEKELEDIRQAKLSDDEKKDLRIKELEKEKEESNSKLKQTNIDSMIVSYASTLGFQDLDVVKLIARKELDGEDEISEEDVKSVIDSIAKEKKYLLGESETTDVGKGNFEGGKKIEGEETIDDRFRKALQQGRTRNVI